jgi:hypothetical protein
MVGKWYKFIENEEVKNFTKNKWYKCIGNPHNKEAFIGNDGKRDGFYPFNPSYFDLSNPMGHNPDEVKEGLDETAKVLSEYLKIKKPTELCNFIDSLGKKEEPKPEKRVDTITIVLFPDGCTQIITTLTKFEGIEALKSILESEIKKINEGN